MLRLMTDAQKLSEIATHKERLWSKEVVNKIIFVGSSGAGLLRVKCFSISRK